MSDLSNLRAVVHGKVQGVYYRAFTARTAKQLSLKGYVRNLPGGQVEVEAEGEKAALEQLLQILKEGPDGAHVDKVDATWSAGKGLYTAFDVRY